MSEEVKVEAPERLHVCRYDNGATALTCDGPPYNPPNILRSGWNAHYVRLDVHQEAIARARADAAQRGNHLAAQCQDLLAALRAIISRIEVVLRDSDSLDRSNGDHLQKRV